MNQVAKVSIVAGVFSSLIVLQTYALSSLSSSQKFTLFRFEFGLCMNAIFVPGTKFLWKRFVKDLLGGKSPRLFHRFFKMVAAIIIVLAYLCPFTNFLITEDPFFNVLCWIACGYIMGLLLLFGILKLLIKCCKHWMKTLDFSDRWVTVSALFFSTFSICLAYSIATSTPVVVKVSIPISKLPQSMDKLRLVLLSDIHLGPTVGTSMVNRIVEISNNLQPDIVVLAGDLTDVSVDKGEAMALPLKYLNSPLGKYYVTGNHEYHTGDVENWFKLMKMYGFQVLHNSNRKIYSKEGKHDWFCLLGTDDLEAHRFGFRGHGMNLQKAYSGCDTNHANVLVTHQPRAAKLALDSDYSIQLVLSGHTHAGQIFPFTIVVYLFNPFFYGLYQYKQCFVYVSQGCAYYGFPLRLFSHPEVTEITFRAIQS